MQLGTSYGFYLFLWSSSFLVMISPRVGLKKASVLSQYLCRSDGICRWGGEEFLLFIPHCRLTDGMKVIEAISATLSDEDFAFCTEPLSISFGVVEATSQYDLDEIVRVADIYLYKAKENGRDRCEGTTMAQHSYD